MRIEVARLAARVPAWHGGDGLKRPPGMSPIMQTPGVTTATCEDLPEVDMKTDHRILAILDEGCNSTCHTSVWAAKAA